MKLNLHRQCMQIWWLAKKVCLASCASVWGLTHFTLRNSSCPAADKIHMHIWLSPQLKCNSIHKPATTWDRAYKEGDHRAQFVCLYHFQHKFCIAGRWSPFHSIVHTALAWHVYDPQEYPEPRSSSLYWLHSCHLDTSNCFCPTKTNITFNISNKKLVRWIFLSKACLLLLILHQHKLNCKLSAHSSEIMMAKTTASKHNHKYVSFVPVIKR